MADSRKLVCLVIVLLILSCSNPRKERTVTRNAYIAYIDSIEEEYQTSLDTSIGNRFYNIAIVPKYVREYLDSIDHGRFLIANPGQPFSKGCARFEDEPDKQLIWAAINQSWIQIEYWQGGIALFKCLLTMKLQSGTVEKHWVDYLAH